MATYTVFIVTRNARHHYPVIMANNGKAILNEPVKRAKDLERSTFALLGEAFRDNVNVERITEKAFKAKFPKYATNKGPKKVVKKVVKSWPQPGDKFVVFQKTHTAIAYGWLTSMDNLMGKVLTCDSVATDQVWPKDYLIRFHPKDIKPAPAKRITKAVTNPVK